MATDAHRLTRQRIVKLTSTGRAKKLVQSRPRTPQNETPQLSKDSPEYLNRLVQRDLLKGASQAHCLEVLPELTGSKRVDLELYALIGLLFRNFVNRWYTSLTDDDTDFVKELIKVISQVARDLEQRVLQVDLLQLVFDDIPVVLDEHLLAYRKINRELGSSYLQFDTIDSAFDYLCPHKALGSDIDDTAARALYLKLLSKNILQILLPKEQRNSQLVTKFMNSLLGDMLLNIIVDKLSQPYQIFEIITLVCELLLSEEPQAAADTAETTSKDSNYDILQSMMSSFSHFIAYSTSLNTGNKNDYRPMVTLQMAHFLNDLFLVSSSRPVLYATLKSLSPILKMEKANPVLCNILQNLVIKPMRSDHLVATIIKTSRNVLFPQDDEMGPPRVEPTPQEFETIRQTTKDKLKLVCRKYQLISYALLTTNEVELDDVLDDFLTSLEHLRINENLVLRLLDLVVTRLFPELCQ